MRRQGSGSEICPPLVSSHQPALRIKASQTSTEIRCCCCIIFSLILNPLGSREALPCCQSPLLSRGTIRATGCRNRHNYSRSSTTRGAQPNSSPPGEADEPVSASVEHRNDSEWYGSVPQTSPSRLGGELLFFPLLLVAAL